MRRVDAPGNGGCPLGCKGAGRGAHGVGPAGRWCVEGDVLGEDRLLHPAEACPRVEPEVVEQAPPALGVGVERLGLTARTVQGEHQQLPPSLAVWVVGDEAACVRDDLGRGARVDRERQAILAKAVDQLLDTCGRDRRLREVLEVGERSTADEPEGGIDARPRTAGVASACPPNGPPPPAWSPPRGRWGSAARSDRPSWRSRCPAAEA